MIEYAKAGFEEPEEKFLEDDAMKYFVRRHYELKLSSRKLTSYPISPPDGRLIKVISPPMNGKNIKKAFKNFKSSRN